MTARKASRVHPKYKTKYRVTNWAEYERGLRLGGGAAGQDGAEPQETEKRHEARPVRHRVHG